jgi:plastocyanin
VSIGDDFFKAKTLTIAAGERVTWSNTGKNVHTVTGDGFDSGELTPGASFSEKFSSPGKYGYVCIYHSGMSGTVKVAGAGGKVPAGSGKPPGGGKAPSGGGGGAGGGGAAPAPGSQTITVTMGSDSFSPGAVNARVGDTVVWKNGSSLPHTVTGGPLSSGMVSAGQSYTAVLRSQGTISYKCDYHAGMTGTVKVAAAPAGTVLPPPSADVGVSGGASSAGGTTSGSGAAGDGSSGPAAPTAPTAKSYTVTMTHDSFDPQVLQARVGDEVTWVNKDPAPHNVTGGPLASDLIMTGGEYSTVLTEAGTIDYECTVHPGMTATLEVAAALPGTQIPPGGSTTSNGSTAAAGTESGASAPSVEPAEGAKNHTVQIVDFLYDPDPLEVHVGDTVTFVNKDAAPHTATADDKSWDSGNLNEGDQWTVELQKTGEIPYICVYHPDMAGTLVVKPKTEELVAAAPSASSADLSGLSARQIAGFASGWLAVLGVLTWLQVHARRRRRAANHSTEPGKKRGALLGIRLLVAGALAVSAYLHLSIAVQTGLEGDPFTMPQLFVIQGVLCLIAAVLVLVKDSEVFWLPALAVAIGSLIPLVASVYFPIPALGPLPALNEPVWYGEKILSMALVAVIPLLWLIRRIAPPSKQVQ